MCPAISDYYNIKRGIVRNDDTPITNEDLQALIQEMRDERIRDEKQNRYLQKKSLVSKAIFNT